MAAFRAIRICVFNHKGGVGKSTLSALLARELALDHHVALVDCDRSSTSSSSALGVDVHSALPYSTADFFRGALPVVPLKPPHASRLHVVPINKAIGDALDKELMLARAEKEAIAGGAVVPWILLDKRISAGLDERYHYVVLDCPPFGSELARMALGAADEVLVPVPLQRFSVGSITDTNDELALVKREGRRVRYVANLAPAENVTEGAAAMDQIMELCGDAVLPVAVPASTGISQAMAEHVGIHTKTRFPAAKSAVRALGDYYRDMKDVRRKMLGLTTGALEDQIRRAHGLDT